MNRTAAAIGLALSLSLHAGLLLVANLPTGPLLTPTVKIALRQIDQPDESAAASTPEVLQSEPRDQAQEQSVQPEAEPPPPVEAEPPQIKTEPQQIAPTESPPKPEPAVAQPPTPAAPPPLAAEPPPDLLPSADQQIAAPPSRLSPDPTPEPPTAMTAAPTAENLLPTATQPTGKVTPPSYIPRPRPYPRLAKQRGWEGTVQLQVDIAADGTVTRVLLEQSSGYPILDQSAIRHIGNSRFRPARRNGTPIEISVQLPVVFELK